MMQDENGFPTLLTTVPTTLSGSTYPIEDFRWVVNVEVRKMYIKPPTTTEETMRRERESAELQMKSDMFAQEIERKIQQ